MKSCYYIVSFFYVVSCCFFGGAAVAAAQEEGKSNRLVNESSPYLLQHAYNPVDWYPWGQEAFEKAKKEGKPIFLSIGYSTCHWCHVMARESFENQQIADYLNNNFISIKVDRELRPDIDAIYMLATESLNGYGGWPMSVFLDTKLRPFHAAVYYPPFTVDGNIGFNEVLHKINSFWKNDPEKIQSIAESVTAHITKQADNTSVKGELSDKIHSLAFEQIQNSYEDLYGGFSVAPKFPNFGLFSYLGKRILVADGQADEMREMMVTTMDNMAFGGLNDQLGGGFHRYSVDINWRLPHFEKMLYSQALMVISYSEFYPIEKKSHYKQVVYETLKFVEREMQSTDGGYYSALNAESKPVITSVDDAKSKEFLEGVYYLWTTQELQSLLSDSEYELFVRYFDVNESGNIETDPASDFFGQNVLFVDEDMRGEALTSQQNSTLTSIKRILNKARQKRSKPSVDEKIITAWNGMLVTAYARAASTFNDKRMLEKAIQLAEFIEHKLTDTKNNQLYRFYINGHAMDAPVLSDYVWVIQGLLSIYRVDEDKRWLEKAIDLQRQQNQLFLDLESMTYFDSMTQDRYLLFRSKNIFDDVLPAANSIALSNLRLLSGYAENSEQKSAYEKAATQLVQGFSAVVNENPLAASKFLSVQP